MPSGRYVRVAYPRNWFVDTSSGEARRYLSRLTDVLLRCSLPAAGRLGRLRAPVVRAGIPAPAVAVLLRASPASPNREFDRLRDDLAEGWGDLASRSDRLPRTCPALSMAFARRSFGWIAFAFGGAGHPLLVCKVPVARSEGVEEEAERLALIGGYPFAPRHLGRIGAAWVQEGLPGYPLRLEPLPRSADAAAFTADGRFRGAADALVRLAQERIEAPPVSWEVAPATRTWMTTETAQAVEGARERVDGRLAAVLRHRDMGPQNALDVEGSFSGFVDWETAGPGAPGADVLQFAVSVFEQRVALRTFDEAHVLDSFRSAWNTAPLFVEARTAVGRALAAAGARQDSSDIEVAFFTDRLQERALRPADHLVPPALAAGMLEHVASSSWHR